MRDVWRKKSGHFLLPSLAVICLLSACSLSSPGSQVVQVNLPQGNSPQSLASQNLKSAARASSSSDRLSSLMDSLSPGSLHFPASVLESTDPPTPMAFGDFNCFAINVRGPGINSDPRLACGDPNNSLGIIAGLIPASSGSIQITIPTGAARTVQLIGLTSYVGCPDLNTLLNNPSSSAFNGIGRPYELGEETIDVFNDVALAMDATYDPNNPKILFQGCGDAKGGEGPSFLPTGIYDGVIMSGTAPSFPVQPFAVVPGAAAGAPEFNQTTPLGPTDVQTAVTYIDNSLPSSASNPGYLFTATGTSAAGARAVIQLQWDAAPISSQLSLYPYASLELEMRGGAEGTACPPATSSNQAFGVFSGVFDNATQTWAVLNQSQFGPGSPTWSWGGTIALPLSLDKAMVSKSDGHKYIIVNVESDYVSSGSGCVSAVHIAGARLRTLKVPQSGNGPNSTPMPIWINGTSLTFFDPTTYAPGYLVPAGGTSDFYSYGGTPPYQYVANRGTIDSTTGHYTAPATTGSDTITVTDSIGVKASVSVQVQPANALLGLSIALDGVSSTTLAAGSCTPITVKTLGFNNTHPSVTAATSIYLNGPPSAQGSSNFYQDASCATSLSSANIAASSNTTDNGANPTIYFKPTLAGNWMIGAYANGLFFGANLGITVTAGTTVGGLNFVAPTTYEHGVCTAISVVTNDGYGNPLTNTTAINSISLVGSPYGHFWMDSACSTAAGTISIPAGAGAKMLYFSSTASSPPYPYTLSISGGGFSTATYNIQEVAVGAATSLKLALDSTTPVINGQCVKIDLTTVGSSGTFVANGAALNVNIDGADGPIYQGLADCQSNGNTIGTISMAASTGAASFWIKIPQYSGGTLGLTARDTYGYPLNSSAALGINY